LLVAARRPRFVALVELLARRHPDIDAHAAVAARRVLVDGSIVTNLRGDVKLSHALDAFHVRAEGRVAVGQLERLVIDGRADLVTLVKPTFELRRGSLAASDDDVAAAIEHAARSIAACGWLVLGCCDALRTGRHGAREAFLHAARVTPRRDRPS
jgi:predicted rRNA methylase YqxC with S4 and FtsJ domains